MLLPDQKNQYRTFIGAMLSVMSIIIVLVFASNKINHLLSYTQYKVQSRHHTFHYDNSERITADHGFMLAAAIRSSATENDQYAKIPEEVGSLRFYRNYWTQTDFGYTEIETRPCKIDDFYFADGSEPAQDRGSAMFYETV